MRYLIFIILSLIAINCWGWQPTYQTKQKQTDYNFNDLSVSVVDNYSDQTVGGNKTFTGNNTFSGSNTFQDVTATVFTANTLSVSTITSTQINVTSVTASGEITSGYGFFHDRGDPVQWDFIISSFTTDGNWHDMDLSQYIPVGAKSVLLRVQVKDDVVDNWFELRKNGNSSFYNIVLVNTMVSNVDNYRDVIVPCDSNRTIEYYATNTTWTTINVLVRGWWK